MSSYFFINILIICCQIAFSAKSPRGIAKGTTSSGREYIIGFMENYDRQNDLELFLTSYSKSKTRVEITSPNFPAAKLNKVFYLGFGDVKFLKIDRMFMVVGCNRTNQTVLVKSDSPIAIYGLNKEPYSTDGFLQLPTNALGMKYFIVSAMFNRGSKSEFLVVGMYDSTYISITLSSKIGSDEALFEGKRYKKEETFSFYLNRYECVQIQSRGDLTGTMVVADKAVGVYSGNDISIVGPGAADHLVEMLPSVDKWGDTFVTTPVPDRKIGDYFKIVSSEDNTRIMMTGECKSNTILAKAGDFYETIISSTDHCYIVADKAILVMQFSQGNNDNDTTDPGDPSMMLVQPLESYVSAVSFTAPKGAAVNYTNYLMITVESKQKFGLILDNQLLQTQFHDIRGTSYSATYIKVVEGSHVLIHKYPNVGFASYLYGRGEFESYLFPVGMRMASVNTICKPSSMVPGDDKDNDCDRKIDEELCTNSDDDDGDGKVNEDCARTSNAFELAKEEISTTICNGTDCDTSLPTTSNCRGDPEENQCKHEEVMVYYRPNWLRYLEVAILFSVTFVFIGTTCCCCKNCCLVLLEKSSDDAEDDDVIYKVTPWRKGRELPMKQPPRRVNV